jgi:peptide-methionine (R)-S-oxide reductase
VKTAVGYSRKFIGVITPFSKSLVSLLFAQGRLEFVGEMFEMKKARDLTEEEWKKKLSKQEYHVLREKGTERASTGKYWKHKEKGIYKCAGCGVELFSSEAKFESGSGWPSFYEALDKDKIEEKVDLSHGMRRIEVVCKNCGGHLGHVFNDGPRDKTGLRYCINSVSLDFKNET